jgi:hypothetical protein
MFPAVLFLEELSEKIKPTCVGLRRGGETASFERPGTNVRCPYGLVHDGGYVAFLTAAMQIVH